MAITKALLKDSKECKVTFTLPTNLAPDAKVVKVVGDFNNWNWDNGLTLKKGKTDYKGQTQLSSGKQYEFRYLIDNQIWKNDLKADAYVASPFVGIENSVVNVPAVTTKKVAVKAAKPATTKAAATVKATTAKTTATKIAKAPVAKKTTAKKKSFDFTLIEGVGPKINTLLINGGFKTFADLAKAKPDSIKEILDAAGSKFQMHDPTTWPAQAKLAAAEKWEELTKLQDELKGGKVAK